MKFKFYFLTSFVLFFILQNQVFCQNSADPILPIEVKEPKSPTTSSLLKYIDFGSLGNNGSPGIDIPLYQIQLKSLSLPISLSYNATGIKVADEAGNVGLNWNLIAGGLISRSIIDKEDNGTYWSDVYSGVTNGLNPTSGLAGYNLGMGIAFGNLDGAPDIYSYNFPGESGKFLNIIGNGIKLIPKKNILIKQTTPNAEDPTQLNYEIITGDGTQYYFEALEKTVTRTLSSVSKSGYTFYLTKIKSATNDDEITFTYVNTHYELLPNVGESSSHTLNCHSVDYVTGSYTPVNSNVGIDGKQLSMINYPSGSVEFKLDWNREDRSNNVLINIIKVDGLVIRNSNQEIIQEIDLLYDYYNAQSTSNYLKRLRLNKIAFKPSPVPGTNSPQYSYRFDYEQTPLPNLFSKSIDHWGYYNGKNNNTIIPDYGLPTLNCHTTLPYCPCINPSNNHFIFHGGNREVDPVYSKAGILNKITYPTGGYCVFDYESNEVAPTQEVGSNSINIPVSITSNSANGIFVDDATTPTAVFASNTLTSNGVCGRVHITYGYPPNTDPILLDHYKPYAVLSEYDVATNSTSIIHTLYLDGVELSKDYDFTLLPNKQYTVLVYTQLQNSTISANLTYNLPYSFTQTHLVGGLRLKEKNIYDRINSQPIVTKYQYSPAGVRQPKYVSENKDWIFEVSECNPTGCWRIGSYDSDGRGIFENNTLNDNISLSAYYKSIDPGTNYFEIKTILGSNGENGSIITDYEIDNMSAPSEASDSWRVGKVLDEISYNSDGDIIKKVHNEYLTESTSTENYPGISYSSIVFPTCLSADFPSYQSFINANGTTPHPASSVWFHQKSTSETIYDIHGQNGVTTSHEYFYENPNHYELTKEKSINSDGSEIINIIRYAQDYNLNLNSADPEITTLKLMGNPIGLHYTGIPIEKIQKKTINGLSYISSGSLITFQQLNSLQTALVPKTVYSIETDNPIPTSSFSSSYTSSTGFLLDSHYKKYFNYDLYDKYGNILITHKENNTNNLIIYLDAGQKPVASFSNSSKGNTSIAADATFCGFEGIQNTNGSFESNDYWNIAPSTLVKDNQTLGTIDIHTGNKSQRVNPYVASANRIISPPNRMQKFRYSAWFYFNGTPSGSASLLAQVLDQNGNPYANGKFETTISFTDGKWIYVENIIDLGEYISSLNPVPSNISLKLSTENKMNEAYYWDDVRFQPYYSNAQTYTYDKLFNQISSVSDERSTPTYFRYDDFGKLKFTNDFNRNLIKYDKYQYDQIAGMNNTITECIFLHSGVSDNTAVSGNLC